MNRWARVVYPTKMGPSPLVGGLFLAGAIRERDRVLDVGCGTGTDALGLARWGVRSVRGIDVSPRAIGIARRRAARERSRARFQVCDALDIPRVFPRGAFDVVVDTMFSNNLPAGAEEAYAAAMDWALARGGCLVAQGRVTRDDFQRERGLPWLESALAARFEARGPVHVALPDPSEGAARVAACLFTRRGVLPLRRRTAARRAKR